MSTLYKALTGSNSKKVNIIRQKNDINDLISVIKKYPDRFLGFSSVPLGVSLAETED